MKISQLIILSALTATTSLAHAAITVFSDNFDSYTPQLNWGTPLPNPLPNGWAVTNGSVDLIDSSGSYFTNPAPLASNPTGNYIDLDGSTNKAGYLQNILNLSAGIQYTLSFDLAGSQRGSTENVNVTFGNIIGSYSPTNLLQFTNHTLDFTPTVTGDYSIIFKNQGGDNIGALLDNVNVTAVPEPETYAMLLAGLGLMGFVARRRNQQA